MIIPVFVAVSQATREKGSLGTASVQPPPNALTEAAHLRKARIQNGIRNLICNLVRVSLTDRFRGEEEAVDKGEQCQRDVGYRESDVRET